MPKLYIRKNTSYYFPLLHTLKTIAKNENADFIFTDEVQQADLVWDYMHADSQPIAIEFYNELEKENPQLSHSAVFVSEPVIRDAKGNPDHLATIFYMLNCLQEYNPAESDLDAFARFRYDASYQHRFDNIEENLAGKLMVQFCTEKGIKTIPNPTAFFISHDIDTLYGSLLQDGFYSLTNLNIPAMLRILLMEFSRKPHWKNMDRIMRINSEYDIKSTFFWLVKKGKGSSGIKNSDYSIAKEQKLLNEVEGKGFINGLHKSPEASSFEEELRKGKKLQPFNRYHFLEFLPHTDWPLLSESPIEFDSSLGFAEHCGFRNSYGNSFQPYDFKLKKPFNFVEAPLVFMDTTFHKYMVTDKNTIADTIIHAYNKNSTNSLLSLLWHNNYFTDFKYNGFLKEYKKVLSFIYEAKIPTLTPSEIVQQTRIAW